MPNSLRLLVPISILLAAAGGMTARSVLSTGDEVGVSETADAEKRLHVEPFSLRGAWRDIGHMRHAIPTSASSGSGEPDAAREAVSTSRARAVPAQLLTGDAEAPQPGEKAILDASTSAIWARQGSDSEVAVERHPEPVVEGASAAVGSETAELQKPAYSERPFDGPRGRDDQPPGLQEPAAQPGAVTEAATSALPERAPVSSLVVGNGQPRTGAAPIRPQPLRRSPTGPRSVHQDDSHLASSLFRDIHYATP